MKVLDFEAMHLFVRVAELGTLSAVARERDVPEPGLEPAVADRDPQQVPVFAVNLADRHRLPKIGACLEWWGEWFERADAVASPNGRRQ